MSPIVKSKHLGPDHTSPYPVSRLAPRFDIIDVKKEYQEAGKLLGIVAAGKLELIGQQIEMLQQQARDIINKAQDDMVLHGAECRFRKCVGQTYHLYRRHHDNTYFSMISPYEWTPPHEYIGSYTLNPDMSWTRAIHAIL